MARLLRIVSSLVTVICVVFFTYQGIQCFVKLTKMPKGTIVSIEDAKRHPLPAISICPLLIYYEDEGLKKRLKECNLK